MEQDEVDTDAAIIIAAAVATFQGDIDMNRHLGVDVVRELTRCGYRILPAMSGGG